MPRRETLEIYVDVYTSIQELTEADRTLLEEARKACDNAYAPYSNFWVGAAFQLAGGEIIKGNNQENAAYPSGLCAERTAVYWLGANRPDAVIETLAISAKHAHADEFLPVTPCGACRQALSEYENKQNQVFRVILEGKNGAIWIVPSVESLLPLKFSGDSLDL
ncbi:MAG: cytidine deaminase [Flammeovirgaceae bacterium]